MYYRCVQKLCAETRFSDPLGSIFVTADHERGARVTVPCSLPPFGVHNPRTTPIYTVHSTVLKMGWRFFRALRARLFFPKSSGNPSFGVISGHNFFARGVSKLSFCGGTPDSTQYPTTKGGFAPRAPREDKPENLFAQNFCTNLY